MNTNLPDGVRQAFIELFAEEVKKQRYLVLAALKIIHTYTHTISLTHTFTHTHFPFFYSFFDMLPISFDKEYDRAGMDGILTGHVLLGRGGVLSTILQQLQLNCDQVNTHYL